MAAAVAAPSQDCFQFRNGNCSYGANCRFLHDGQETLASRRKQTQICFEFRDKNACQYGDQCRYSHDLSAANKPESKDAPAERAPRQRKERAPREPREAREAKAPSAGAESGRLDCYNFKSTGTCHYGDTCRFLHTGSATRGSRSKESQVCFEFRDSGKCQFGAACRFAHENGAASSGAGAGAGAGRGGRGAGAGRGGRQQTGGKKVCRDFLNGSCAYGDTCKFLHQSAPDQE